jgi:hypothetical protein
LCTHPCCSGTTSEADQRMSRCNLPHFELVFHQLVRHRVVITVDFNVVVDCTLTTGFQSYHWKSPMRVHIEVEKFSNLKFSFIFSDKDEGSIPASTIFYSTERFRLLWKP